jgi:hypothetical protein
MVIMNSIQQFLGDDFNLIQSTYNVCRTNEPEKDDKVVCNKIRFIKEL